MSGGGPADPSWWAQNYGPVGAVAGLAIAALAWMVRSWVLEAKSQRVALEAKRDAVQAQTDALRAQIAEIIKAAHTETLTLLAKQREDFDERLDAMREAAEAKYAKLEEEHRQLLERHAAAASTARDKMAEVAAASVRAVEAIAPKVKAARGERT